MEGAEAVDVIVGNNFVYLAARLGAFPRAGVIGYLENVRYEH